MYPENYINKVSPLDHILDYLFKGTEPTYKSITKIVLVVDLVLLWNSKGPEVWFPRELTNSELMKFYYINIPTVSHIDSQTSLETILDHLLLYIIPCKTRGHSIDHIFDSYNIMNDLV